MKKFLSVVIVFVMVLSLLTGAVSADDPKGEITFVPIVGTSNSADPDTGFVLSGNLTFDEASQIGISDKGILLDVSPMQGGGFLVKPDRKLSHNRLYVFTLPSVTGDIKWSIQTRLAFECVSTLPANGAENVTVDTGIEFEFSSADYSGIEEAFSITPHTEGRFEYHNETAVFVPSEPLKYGAYYTVSLDSLVKSDTLGNMENDIEFTFVTEPEGGINRDNQTYINVNQNYNYISTNEYFTATVYGNKDGEQLESGKMTYALYRIDDIQKAAEYHKSVNTAWNGAPLDLLDLSLLDSGDIELLTDEEMGFGLVFEYGKKLSCGFYVMEAYVADSNKVQMLFTVTDLSVNCTVSESGSVIWVNDAVTHTPVQGVTVTDESGAVSSATDKNGVAFIESDKDENEFLYLNSSDGDCLYISTGNYGKYYNNRYNHDYWQILQLDRGLFKKNDTVHFWGFVKHRYGEAVPDELTVQITRGYWSREDNIMLKERVKSNDGIYDGFVKLPELDSGFYYLEILIGNTIVSSVGFSVEEYVKPAYKMTVTPSVKAARIGEEISFLVNASFFDGTPVPELDVSYALNFDGNRINNTGVTDADGNLYVRYVPEAKKESQGFKTCRFTAEATLPEQAYISGNSYVYVAINDVMAAFTGTRDGKKAQLNAQVNGVVIDKARETGNIYGDECKGDAVSGKTLKVEIYKRYYEKTQSGTHYDFIEKKTVTSYRYETRTKKLSSFEMKTTKDGSASKSFTLPNKSEECYYAEIKLKDNSGRDMKYTKYFGREYPLRPVDEGLSLALDKETYCAGDMVKATVSNNGKVLSEGRILYMVFNRGIKEYVIEKDGEYSFVFDSKYIPNATVMAVYYGDDGNYRSLSQSVNLDKEDRNLSIDISTDLERYAPGDECTLNIRVTDKDGNPQKSYINIAIVDEALLELNGYTPDALNALYSWVPDGHSATITTHYRYDGNNRVYGMASGGGGMASDSMLKNESAVAMPESPSASKSESAVREDFKDTALFESFATDETGKAGYTFVLPHNTTSWRVCVSGVTEELYAGTATSAIVTTLPVFINYTLPETFLTGDIPSVGVSAYGDGIASDDMVEYEVYDANDMTLKSSSAGKAYERVNIPLWKFENEGNHELIIKAVTSGGLSDAVKHKYKVVSSYRTAPYTVSQPVSVGMDFDAKDASGLVNVRFSDGITGDLMRDLILLSARSYGERVEKKVTRFVANPVINEYFDLDFDVEELNLDDYYDENGGLCILPRSSSNVEVTAKILHLLGTGDYLDEAALRKYFSDIYYGDNSQNKIMALYGLSLLGEPVMGEPDGYAQLEDISVKDMAYLGLCYVQFGKYAEARMLFNRILSATQYHSPYAYIVHESKDESLRATSAAMMLALKLGADEAAGYYKYCSDNCTDEFMKNIEELTYITETLASCPQTHGTVTYSVFGEERTAELITGKNCVLTIPAASLDELEVTACSENASVLMTYTKPMADAVSADTKVTVKRCYYKAGVEADGQSTCEFEQGDIIRVNLWIDYSDIALDGSYLVSEYLPSGLEYVSGSAKLPTSEATGRHVFAAVDGKKITFCDYNGIFNTGRLYYYYARVVSPGTYRAEGTTVQKTGTDNVFTFGTDDKLVIADK